MKPEGVQLSFHNVTYALLHISLLPLFHYLHSAAKTGIQNILCCAAGRSLGIVSMFLQPRRHTRSRRVIR